MIPLSKIDVAKILAVEFIFFQHTPITPELAKAWHLHFRNCDRQEFFAAIHIAVTEGAKGFPPTPGEVWGVIRKLRASKESLETSDQAWAALMDNKPASERANAATLLMPDWKNRRMWQTEFIHFRKKEFDRIYDDLKEKDQILETQNIARSELGYGREALPALGGQLMEVLEWL